MRNLSEPGSGGSAAYFQAFTFFVLPHGLLAMSIATTFVPEMARAVGRRDRRRFTATSSLGVRIIAMLTIPAAVVLFVLRRPLIGLLLQHGEYTALDALVTSRALAGFALGLPAFSVYLFALRGFYAHQDTRTPFIINAGQCLLNIAFAFAFFGPWGVLGLGAAFALSYALAGLWALSVLATKVRGYPFRGILESIARMTPRRRPRRRSDVVGRPPDRRQLRRRCADPPPRRHASRRSSCTPSCCSSSPRPSCGRCAVSAGRRCGPRHRPRRIGRMFNLFKKWWKYLTAKLTGSFEERADPKVQLEQAITEARSAHIRLKEQAANVIANQKQSELRLNSKLAELEKLNANARQALVMAADAEKAGDAAKAQQYNSAAETIANQLIQVEKDIESLKSLVLESAKASDQAKAAVEQNSRMLQQKISEKSKLMSQLDQAKMQEEMNSAMAQLNEQVGADVPSFDEVREKIEARYAKRQGTCRAQRGVGRVTRPRGRAGDGQHRGAEPAQPAALRARPRLRPGGRVGASSRARPAAAEQPPPPADRRRRAAGACPPPPPDPPSRTSAE